MGCHVCYKQFTRFRESIFNSNGFNSIQFKCILFLLRTKFDDTQPTSPDSIHDAQWSLSPHVPTWFDRCAWVSSKIFRMLYATNRWPSSFKWTKNLRWFQGSDEKLHEKDKECLELRKVLSVRHSIQHEKESKIRSTSSLYPPIMSVTVSNCNSICFSNGESKTSRNVVCVFSTVSSSNSSA